jgi:signal transduction histidine kinase
MINFFSTGIKFVKENPKILYSVALLVLIPLALFYNIFFAINSFQKNTDYIMQTNALLTESISSRFIADFVSNKDALQEKIDQVATENPEVAKIWVAFPENDKLKIAASKEKGEIGQEIEGDPLNLAWMKNQAIAFSTTGGDGERFWEVVKPIENSDGSKIAAIGIAMSLKNVDALTKETVYWSYLIAIIAIVLALFLIIHHTVLFSYVALSKKLEEIDRMKDDFIRMATHELQTPIANIRGYTEMLGEEIGGMLNGEQKEFLNRISISSKNLADLIFDILEVSRIEQGRLDFTPQAASPVKIIKEAIEELKGKAAEKKLELLFVGEDADVFLSANQTRLKQIVVNLITNAIKYTPSGKIEAGVSIDRASKRCSIFVRDTGLGISAEAQKRLFERFYRVRTDQTANIPGTGLGLWITKQLCEKMGGSIFLESMEGVGSKITLVFPVLG